LTPGVGEWAIYEITFTSEASRDLKALRKHEQQEILDGIDDNLRHEPTTEIRNRLRMRPNELAEWELRLGSFRVFYNVFEERGLDCAD
jgi:mRNA-degrading endonuclease RelE of RelBE toxin-antitoxin system